LTYISFDEYSPHFTMSHCLFIIEDVCEMFDCADNQFAYFKERGICGIVLTPICYGCISNTMTSAAI